MGVDVSFVQEQPFERGYAHDLSRAAEATKALAVSPRGELLFLLDYI